MDLQEPFDQPTSQSVHAAYDYLLDLWQRGLLYADVMRKRGNQYQEHLALVKGDVSDGAPVMVRMHAVDLLDDMTGQPHWIAVHNAMHMIGMGMGEHDTIELTDACHEQLNTKIGRSVDENACRHFGIAALNHERAAAAVVFGVGWIAMTPVIADPGHAAG